MLMIDHSTLSQGSDREIWGGVALACKFYFKCTLTFECSNTSYMEQLSLILLNCLEQHLRMCLNVDDINLALQQNPTTVIFRQMC